MTNAAQPPRKRWCIWQSQRYTGAMNLLRVTLLGIACAALPVVCLAQWQWVDKDGRKVFSDQSPPADIPAKNILRQPGVKGRPLDTATTANPAPAAPVASAPRISGKDKALEEKKRLADASEADKKKAQEEEVAKARADNCDRAKRSKMTIDAGGRLSQVNAKGEREIMDDAQRAAESKRLERIIASDCKPA